MEKVAGIDVSKDRLDVAVLPQGESFFVSNNHTGIGELIDWMKANGVDVFALETTGGYETLAVSEMLSAGLEALVLNPAQIRANAIIREQKPWQNA
jgi:transposase